MIDAPSLDFFYGEDGSLAAPYLTRVLAEDPLFRATLAKMDMDAVKHPKNLSFHQDSRIFFSTLPVKAGTRHGQAWLHIGVICGEPTKAQKRQALRKRPAEFCTAKECHGWQIERIVGLLSGRQTTGAEALDEYFALQKAASIANGAACTRRVPVGHTAAQRRGHGLFSAAGLALWGLLAHALYNSAESDVETALEELQHMRCWLRPRWISLDPYWDDEVLATAFLAAGIGCPNTSFSTAGGCATIPCTTSSIPRQWKRIRKNRRRISRQCWTVSCLKTGSFRSACAPGGPAPAGPPASAPESAHAPCPLPPRADLQAELQERRRKARRSPSSA